MNSYFSVEPATALITVLPVAGYDAWLSEQSKLHQTWLASSGFKAKVGKFSLLPNAEGGLATVLVLIDEQEPVWALAALPSVLPAGNYALSGVSEEVAYWLGLGWGLACYRYDRYKTLPAVKASLQLSPALLQKVTPFIQASTQVRDLVNTPAADLGPEQIAEQIESLGQQYQAKVEQWVGDELLTAGFEFVHTVGRAANRAPRMIALTWGKESDPKVTLVGKGVCFDTGGLDIKPSGGMRWMKKDMGGAAHVIALAGLIMQAGLAVRLKLLVPAVENSVSANAMRPGDVVKMANGVSVEIDNTDAEGRLILGDALAYGSLDQPELMIDMATLTGAARVALGPDLPALFVNQDQVALDVLAQGIAQHDPLWRLPLHKPYERYLESYIADLSNSASTGHGGAITAALYLQRMVAEKIDWIHIDVYAWNDSARPGRPKGGEAYGLRALFAYLTQRYG